MAVALADYPMPQPMTPAAAAADLPWQRLTAELDAWAAAGRRAPIWWRDDDATVPGPALDRLIALTDAAGSGLVLAVIPADAGPALAERLAAPDARHVTIAQHGWAHANHAPAGQKKMELGDHRPAPQVWAELDKGRRHLTDLFGAAPTMLVPPWNRIGAAVAAGLADLGYRTLSLFGDAAPAAPGLAIANTHCDPIAWKKGRSLAPDALAGLIAALAEQRTTDAPTPVGILTHHRDQDDDVWRFVDRLAETVAGHPGAQWVVPSESHS